MMRAPSAANPVRRMTLVASTIAATALLLAVASCVGTSDPDEDHRAGPDDPPVFRYADGETELDPDDPLVVLLGGEGGGLAAELEDRFGLTADALAGEEPGTGGYQVVLTIDPELQAQAEAAGDRGALAEDPSREQRAFADDNPSAALSGFDPSTASATVSIDPATGAVLAYYGGGDVGRDLAAAPHPPSSAFHLITAAVAIKHGASYESMWDASSPREFSSLEGIGFGDDEGRLRNGDSVAQEHLTLAEAVQRSRRTAMYAIAERWGATAILETAVDMGLTMMVFHADYESEGGERFSEPVEHRFRLDRSYSRHGVTKDARGEWLVDRDGNLDLEASIDGYDDDGAPVRTYIDPTVASLPVYYHVSLGQYPVSVRDMAAIYATIANDGVHVETHVVERVLDANGVEVPPVRQLGRVQALDAGIARDLQFIASEIDDTSFDRFGLPGTWEARDGDGNAHAWYVGAIRQLSTAVWVGNVDDEGAPLSDARDSTDEVYGATIAYPIWERLTNEAIDVKDWQNEPWEGPMKIGSPITDDIDRA